jgi:hypothetical protein
MIAKVVSMSSSRDLVKTRDEEGNLGFKTGPGGVRHTLTLELAEGVTVEMNTDELSMQRFSGAARKAFPTVR